MKKVLKQIPRLVVGAPHGRSGKTTVTLGLLAALKQKGYSIQPFKKGPDFIDPSWMTLVTGVSCRNLDPFFMSKELIRHSFCLHGAQKSIAVVEGAMGLFDGVDIQGSGSTAEIAKIIEAPVILVVDSTRMTRSVAPLVNGFLHFDTEVTIAGVILNKVARSRHETMLRQAIETYCGIPVLGVLPKGKGLTIPDRHLGLIPAGERKEIFEAVERIGKAALDCLDIKTIVSIATAASPLPIPKADRNEEHVSWGSCSRNTVKIGIFKDVAFSFYYPENLDALVQTGAELCYVDALHDKELPEIDALYIGGGFPEIFAAQLEENVSLRQEVKSAADRGLPIYAECGGLIYLSRRMVWDEKTYAMAGVLPLDILMTDKPQGHGYEVVTVDYDNPFFEKGTVIKGHEFHNSKVLHLDEDEVKFAFRVDRGNGLGNKRDGIMRNQVLAAYSHVHALSTPQWAPALVKQANIYRESQQGKN